MGFIIFSKVRIAKNDVLLLVFVVIPIAVLFFISTARQIYLSPFSDEFARVTKLRPYSLRKARERLATRAVASSTTLTMDVGKTKSTGVTSELFLSLHRIRWLNIFLALSLIFYHVCDVRFRVHSQQTSSHMWFVYRLVFESIRDCLMGVLLPVFAVDMLQITLINASAAGTPPPVWISLLYYMLSLSVLFVTVVLYVFAIWHKSQMYIVGQQITRDVLFINGSIVAIVTLVKTRRDYILLLESKYTVMTKNQKWIRQRTVVEMKKLSIGLCVLVLVVMADMVKLVSYMRSDWVHDFYSVNPSALDTTISAGAYLLLLFSFMRWTHLSKDGSRTGITKLFHCFTCCDDGYGDNDSGENCRQLSCEARCERASLWCTQFFCFCILDSHNHAIAMIRMNAEAQWPTKTTTKSPLTRARVRQSHKHKVKKQQITTSHKKGGLLEPLLSGSKEDSSPPDAGGGDTVSVQSGRYATHGCGDDDDDYDYDEYKHSRLTEDLLIDAYPSATRPGAFSLAKGWAMKKHRQSDATTATMATNGSVSTDVSLTTMTTTTTASVLPHSDLLLQSMPVEAAGDKSPIVTAAVVHFGVDSAKDKTRESSSSSRRREKRRAKSHAAVDGRRLEPVSEDFQQQSSDAHSGVTVSSGKQWPVSTRFVPHGLSAAEVAKLHNLNLDETDSETDSQSGDDDEYDEDDENDPYFGLYGDDTAVFREGERETEIIAKKSSVDVEELFDAGHSLPEGAGPTAAFKRAFERSKIASPMLLAKQPTLAAGMGLSPMSKPLRAPEYGEDELHKGKGKAAERLGVVGSGIGGVVGIKKGAIGSEKPAAFLSVAQVAAEADFSFSAVEESKEQTKVLTAVISPKGSESAAAKSKHSAGFSVDSYGSAPMRPTLLFEASDGVELPPERASMHLSPAKEPVPIVQSSLTLDFEKVDDIPLPGEDSSK